MSIQSLSLANIEEIDGGKVAVAFAVELQHVIKDMLDRPGDNRPRKVSLNLELKPQCDDSGTLADVQVAFDIASSVPNRRSNAYNMRARLIRGGGAQLVFQAETNDFEQPALPYEAAE